MRQKRQPFQVELERDELPREPSVDDEVDELEEVDVESVSLSSLPEGSELDDESELTFEPARSLLLCLLLRLRLRLLLCFLTVFQALLTRDLAEMLDLRDEVVVTERDARLARRSCLLRRLERCGACGREGV